MRPGARIFGVAGGALILIAATAALISGGADTVIVGGWITVAAAIVAIIGAALTEARRGVASLLMALAFLAVAVVAPGVIPAIADSTAVFLGYVAGSALLLIGAILAFRHRNLGPANSRAAS